MRQRILLRRVYTFLDKASRSITLKPEGTAPIARGIYRAQDVQPSIALEIFVHHYRIQVEASGRKTASVSSIWHRIFWVTEPRLMEVMMLAMMFF